MIVVNLFGGPGTGKSTTAAGLFYELKRRNINCELVTEYAKELTWEERHEVLKDQLYITAKQNRRLERLKEKVDIVITDSPLFLGMQYVTDDYGISEEYKTLLLKLVEQYRNYNFIIPRLKPYNPIGRNQDEEEAKSIDNSLVNLLTEHGQDYVDLRNTPSYSLVLGNILDELKIKG